MAAVFASNSGEAVMENAAIEVTVDDHFDIRRKKAILFGKTVVVNLFKSLVMILNTLIILRIMWFTWLINWRRVGHGPFFLKRDEDMPDSLYYTCLHLQPALNCLARKQLSANPLRCPTSLPDKRVRTFFL
jgi:hypothetical protein